MTQTTWPALSEFEFVTGRSATAIDIKQGRAAFQLTSDKGLNLGEPMNLAIPQYAWHKDNATGKKQPVVIIQAEEVKGGPQAIGYRTLKGELKVGLRHEFELLGTQI